MKQFDDNYFLDFKYGLEQNINGLDPTFHVFFINNNLKKTKVEYKKTTKLNFRHIIQRLKLGEAVYISPKKQENLKSKQNNLQDFEN